MPFGNESSSDHNQQKNPPEGQLVANAFRQ